MFYLTCANAILLGSAQSKKERSKPPKLMPQRSLAQLHPPEIEKWLLDLARIHRFAFTCDANGCVDWMTPDLEALGLAAGAGAVAADVIPELAEGLGFGAGGQLDQATLTLRTRSLPIAVSWIDGSVGGETLRAAILKIDGEDPHGGLPRQPGADLLESILENSPDGVLALDRSGFIAYANSAFETLTGFSRDELKGRPAFHLVASHPVLLDAVSEIECDGELRCDLACGARGGLARSLSVSSQPLILPGGERAGRAVFLRDITERQQILDQLESKNAELENYVDTVSHDLRSPLVSILGFAHLLRQDYGASLDETAHHFLDRIEQAGRTMDSLTDDLLSLSKIGQIPIRRRLIDPSPVLAEIQAELKPRLEARRIRLLLPNDPPFVYSDETRLYQIFSNLVGNALQHMGSPPLPVIEVDIFARGEEDVLCVADNGDGVLPEDRNRIFQAFQRAKASTSEREGRSSGMGLAIVRKIASLHSGRAWVEDNVENGARFYVSLSRR